MQTITPVEAQLEFDRTSRMDRARVVLAERESPAWHRVALLLPVILLSMFSDPIAKYLGTTPQVVQFWFVLVFVAVLADREIRVLKRKVAALTELVQEMRKG